MMELKLCTGGPAPQRGEGRGKATGWIVTATVQVGEEASVQRV